MDVGVAHAAERDLDLHVVRTGRAPGDLQRHQGLITGVRAVGLDGGRGEVGDGWAHEGS